MRRHTVTEIVNHSRSTALERSVKPLLIKGSVCVCVCVCGGGGGGGWPHRFYVAATLALSSLVLPWYTQNISSLDIKCSFIFFSYFLFMMKFNLNCVYVYASCRYRCIICLMLHTVIYVS